MPLRGKNSDWPARPAPGEAGARQITRAEARAAGLPDHTVLMVDPGLNIVMFWEKDRTGKLMSLLLGFVEVREARERLEDFWKGQRLRGIEDTKEEIIAEGPSVEPEK